MKEEKRIYVVVAETVQTSAGNIVQPCGRVAAQVAHVVSKMQIERHRHINSGKFTPITTIVLAASDSREMNHTMRLCWRSHLEVTYFEDANEPVYGPDPVLTAICTEPISQERAAVFQALSLWEHGKSLPIC